MGDSNSNSTIALVLSIVAILVSGWQAWEARQTRREAERAWLNVTEVAPLPTVEGHKPTMRVKFANNGHTPAQDTVVAYQVTVADRFQSPSDPPEANFKNPVLVAPGAHSHVDISVVDGLTADQIQQFKAGQQAMYIFGVFRYSDLYKNRHFTRFCFNYDMPTMTFVSCPSYNSAD